MTSRHAAPARGGGTGPREQPPLARARGRRRGRRRRGGTRLREQSLLTPLPASAYGTISCCRCLTSGEGAVLGTLHGTDVFPDHRGRLRPHPWSAVVSCKRCGMIAAVCQGELYPPDDWPGDRNVPAHVLGAYAEARECLAAGQHTAVAMLCRKLIMNLVVDHGARAGKRYAEYVDWLVAKGYITGSIREQIEFVRVCGNNASHDPNPVGKKRAMATFMLATELLRRLYELEYLPDEYFAAYCEPMLDALPAPLTPAEIRNARDARARMCPPSVTLDEYTGADGNT